MVLLKIFSNFKSPETLKPRDKSGNILGNLNANNKEIRFKWPNNKEIRFRYIRLLLGAFEDFGLLSAREQFFFCAFPKV